MSKTGSMSQSISITLSIHRPQPLVSFKIDPMSSMALITSVEKSRVSEKSKKRSAVYDVSPEHGGVVFHASKYAGRFSAPDNEKTPVTATFLVDSARAQRRHIPKRTAEADGRKADIFILCLV